VGKSPNKKDSLTLLPTASFSSQYALLLLFPSFLVFYDEVTDRQGFVILSPLLLSPPTLLYQPPLALMARFPLLAFLFLLIATLISADTIDDDFLRLPSQASRFFRSPSDDDKIEGTRWAILIAGSNGYWNYRHQVTHLPLYL